MKQIIQSLKTGETTLEDIPVPLVTPGTVLIRTTRTLVSLGTERMLVHFGQANLIQKARQQPDRVRQVLQKIKTDGLTTTLETVRNKLDSPVPLGYCNVGNVIAVGEGVHEFKIGDRVVSNGNHAEYVCIPQNLIAAIPDHVCDEDATFTVVGAIGLQGIRLCNPTFGETIVVTGLGLIGLIVVQLLLANGCRVIGLDPDEKKLELAKQFGALGINPLREDAVKRVESETDGAGADGIIITASAKTNEIVHQAAEMSRKRGRIVLIGVVGLDISRDDFYKKELSFQVSCSYGPGRYDEKYELQGIDYPLPYVRWTEKRNFQAILQALARGTVRVQPLITGRHPLVNYNEIYGHLDNSGAIANILEYPADASWSNVVNIIQKKRREILSKGRGVGIIGAGNYTRMMVLPQLRSLNADLVAIASAHGVNGTSLAKKYNFQRSTTDYREILSDPEVNLVIITTRHNEHARMTLDALKAGKHVFVEKPLAINEDELKQIINAYDGSLKLTVGYNRRFSPHIKKVKSLFGSGIMNVIATMNAGYIPAEMWVQDMKTGGGRIIGEACHYFDLITYLTGSKIQSVCMNAMGVHPEENTDNASILLKYHNGSTGVINYFSNGSKSYSKERIEVYSQGRTAVVDNFRTTIGYGFKGFSKLKTKLDKGQKNQFKLLNESLTQGGKALIPFDEIINTTQASFAAIQSLKSREWATLG